MNHQQATQLTAVDKYLLDELTPEVRDEFEEHFFDCQECALDLRATAGFMDAAKDEFKANPVRKPVASGSKRSFALFRPALVWSALAASLLVIAYQNVAVFPRLTTEIAEMKAPEILPSLSLVGGNSRGGQIPAVTVGANKPFLLLLDIPTQDRFSSYTCLLYSPSGSLAGRVEVSGQLAKDTVSIRVPSTGTQSGPYVLKVQGNMPGSAVDLAQYRFSLNSQN
jgi:Putative zinc-finger